MDPATSARTLERRPLATSLREATCGRVITSGSPSANVPFEAKLLRRIVGVADSRLQRLGSDALLTAIKSASFPMALLHGFLDRHPLRRKRQYYIKISAPRGARKGEPGFSQVAARLVNAPTAAQGRRQFGDVEVEPRAFCMEARFIWRNFTERARRLISRNAGIAARVFAQTASAP